MTPYKMQNLVHVNGSIFPIFPKFEQKLAKFKKIWVILLKISPKIGQIGNEWVTFSKKIGICIGLLSNPTVAHPYQNQT